MKKLFILLVAATTMLVSCGTQQKATSSSTSSTSSQSSSANMMGKNAASAIDMLYANYKNDGKLDFTNLMNVSSTLNLVGASQQLVKNKSDKAYRQQFVSGMIANSVNIDELNGETIREELESLAEKTDVTKLTQAMETAEVTATEVQNVKNSVTNIINTFKK